MAKPCVSIIYSSLETKYTSQYLGALLFLGGYSKVKVSALPTVKGVSEKAQLQVEGTEKHILVSVNRKTEGSKTVAECSDFCLNVDFKDLTDSNIVIVCVASCDTERCSTLLSKMLVKNEKMPVGVFTFQNGVKNFEKLDSLKSLGHLVFDSAIGFHVVKRRTDGVLMMAVEGQLVIERLSKEKAEVGAQFINLLSTSDIPILFRRNLTCKRHWCAFCSCYHVHLLFLI
jgi:ketopantoate reductase